MPAKTILVVDDEAAVRSYIRAILGREGFSLIEAVDGADALQQVQQRGTVDLLVTDIRMPRMNGIELGRTVAESYPGTPIIYISGYPFDMKAGEKPTGECAFLSKPFTRKALLDAVAKCLHPAQSVDGGEAA